MDEEIIDNEILSTMILHQIVQEKKPEKYKVLGDCWHTPGGIFGMQLYIGIVAVETFEPTGEWKAYIGIVLGIDSEGDKQAIAARGASIRDDLAHAYFPYLDITKYKDS